MNAQELRQKNRDELKQELEDLLRQQFNLRMQRGMGEDSKTHHFKLVRRDIARVKTIINEQERSQ